MIIVPTTHLNKDKIIVEAIFTPEEKTNPLFSSTRESLRTTKQSIKTMDTTLTITKTLTSKEDPQTMLGILVDEIREKYCGDVITPPIKTIDTKTKEVIYETKDLTTNPQFKLGEVKLIETSIDDIVTPITPIKPVDPIIRK